MLRFFKCRDVKSPCKAHDTDAGYDMFIPNILSSEDLRVKNPHNKVSNNTPIDSSFCTCDVNNIIISFSDYCCILKSSDMDKRDAILHAPIEKIELYPGGRILIPSGIHVDFPEGYALINMNKSGVATKRGLVVGAAVIDKNYQGECHISLINTSNEIQIIEAGEKIVQAVLVKIGTEQTEEVKSLEELYPQQSTRNSGGFGSTGTK